MPLLKLLIIRHGFSEGNRDRRMMGHLDDALTSEGVIQVQALAHRLVAECCMPTAIYSSPLRRAAQTAELLLASVLEIRSFHEPEQSAAVGLEPQPLPVDRATPLIQFCDELKEFQNGIFQGLTWAEAQQQYPQLCQQLETSMDWIAIPGAESLQDGRMRAREFVQALLTQHSGGDVVWVISHEWLMQHLIAEVMGCDRTWGLSIPNTSVFEFWLDRQRWFTHGQNQWNAELWKIRRFNDTSHLHSPTG